LRGLPRALKRRGKAEKKRGSIIPSWTGKEDSLETDTRIRPHCLMRLKKSREEKKEK